jgi:two-component system cell cycle sensor histidine kinase/response regulator CckA
MTDNRRAPMENKGNAPEKNYRILIVEDSAPDADINEREVKKVLSPCRFLRVETGEAFSDALDQFTPDAVVSDFTMPHFDGLSVLRIAREKSPFTPVLIVTGSIDEETAVACLKAGAVDYILKENIKRLGPALLTALTQKDARIRHYETQEALYKSEEQYRSLFENDPAGDFIAAADGVILSCNRAFAAMLGFRSAQEAVKLSFFQFCRQPRQYEGLLQLLGGGRNVEHYEMELARRDGSVAYMRVNAYGVFNSANSVDKIVGFLIDETERRRLEDRLAQTQKMESLGTLAGGIAHDFNNLLNIILGYLSLLENAAGERADTPRLLETIRRAAERGANLIKQLLTFARKSEPRLDPVRLSEVAGDVVKLARETFPRTIEITTAGDDNAPLVTADAAQLHQAFLNLCLNARDAMPGGGRLSVSHGKVDRVTLASRYPDTEGEEYSFIRIEDTGAGMDESVKKRVFEPFFTTKGQSAGTGLGLSLVYGIVKEHRGYIDIQSEPGQGAAFTVYLPTRTEADRPEAARAPTAEPAGGTETILLIEDEDTLRDFMETILKSRGYNVLATADGAAGFDLFREHRSTIDIVISDFGLPKMDGGELFKRMRAIDDHARMILMSGFIDPNVKPFMAEAGIAQFLQKPFTPVALLAAIRETLKEKKESAPPQPWADSPAGKDTLA